MSVFSYFRGKREKSGEGLRGLEETQRPASVRLSVGSKARVRKHYRFWGKVQFVGFRYRSKYLADELGLTGWVQNEEDGSVEMEIQGEADKLADFLRQLYGLPGIRIEDREDKTVPWVSGEKAFRVRG